MDEVQGAILSSKLKILENIKTLEKNCKLLFK